MGFGDDPFGTSSAYGCTSAPFGQQPNLGDVGNMFNVTSCSIGQAQSLGSGISRDLATGALTLQIPGVELSGAPAVISLGGPTETSDTYGNDRPARARTRLDKRAAQPKAAQPAQANAGIFSRFCAWLSS